MEGSTLTIEIVAVILGSSVITAVINWMFNKKGSKADIELKEAQADSLIVQACNSLLKEISAQYEVVKQKCAELEKDHGICTDANKELLKRIEILESKIQMKP